MNLQRGEQDEHADKHNSARVGVKRRRPASDGRVLAAHLGLISAPALVLQHEVGGRRQGKEKERSGA